MSYWSFIKLNTNNSENEPIDWSKVWSKDQIWGVCALEPPVCVSEVA